MTRLHEAAQYFQPNAVDISLAKTTSLVFTFVRHPFERLVSAFRDKFELSRKYGYVYSRYAGKILKQPAGINSRRPTFKEFVKYLLIERLEEYNDHWLPYWLHCHMCEMEYDVIGKLETWNEDVEFITGMAWDQWS